MSGNAKSQKFMLGTAEVMIGNPEDVYKLNPAENGVGLVKNFSIEASKDQTELTQGRTNDIIVSLTTGQTTRGSFEMYEYTTENLSYALGLEGSDLISPSENALETTTEASFASGSVDLEFEDATDIQNILVGNRVLLRDPSTDTIVAGTATSVSGVTGNEATAATMTVSIPDTVAVSTFAAGTQVSLVNVLDIGSTDTDRYYSAKVQGQLADGQYIVLLIPKIRVSSGLTMSFTTDNFGNVPFEFTPMKPISGDPFYSQFKGKVAELLTDTVTAPIV
jgi:hypothetical protein